MIWFNDSIGAQVK